MNSLLHTEKENKEKTLDEFHKVYQDLQIKKPWYLYFMPKVNTILVVNRKDNEIVEEVNPIATSVALEIGQTFSHLTTESKAVFTALTHKAGQHFTDPKSVQNIPAFVAAYRVDMTEVIPETYTCFNHFFYRKINLNKRVIPENENLFLAAADCRLSTFLNENEATKYWIKGKHFTLKNLTQIESINSQSRVIIHRLAPCDYHRWHHPFSGVCKKTTIIPGTYYTVNPLAVRSDIDVFTENHRTVRIYNTDHFGQVVEVAIGALLVGSIHLNEENIRVMRGDEAGFFAYGGSTVIYIIDNERITMDNDLCHNSFELKETLVECRTRIGCIPNYSFNR